MMQKPKILDQKAEELITQIRLRTQNLFLTRQLMCAESILTVLNQGLGGGLSQEMAVRLTSGLPEGLGGSGCTCGALSGSILALGLFLGRSGPGWKNGKLVMSAARMLHEHFKDRFGAICCRLLTKHLKRGSKEHFQSCSVRTGFCAEISTRIILQNKPELIRQTCISYLTQKDSKFDAILKQVSNTIRR